MTADVVNDLIDQSIDALVNDSPEKAAEALQELAHMWVEAGIPMQSFLDIRTFIVNQATQQTSSLFIQEKLTVQEQILKGKRNDSRKIITS